MFALLMLGLLGLALSPQVSASAPNIVLYLSDDVGVGLVNQHAPEWSFAESDMDIPPARRIHTPTLERLAREGKRFFNSYAASPVCGPSRHSLLTGIQTGMQPIAKGNGFGPGGTTDVDLEESFTTVAEALETVGYINFAVGKWGVATDMTSSGSPCRRGFHYFFGHATHKSVGHAFPATISSCTINQDGVAEFDTHSYPENDQSSMTKCHGTNRCTYFDHEIRRKALAMVESHLQETKDRPFFLYWATTAGHSSLYPQEEKFGNCELKTHPVPDFGRYTAENLEGTGRVTPEIQGLMAMMEHTVDEDIKQLLALLELHEIQNNTLLIVASDNGPHCEAFADPDYNPILDVSATAGLPGIKRRMYEGGLRSPTLVWWPKVVPGGTISRYPFMLYDVPLTLLDAAGLSANAPIRASFTREGAGGVSVLGAMVARSDAQATVLPNRSWLYAELCFLRAGTNNNRKVCPVFWSENLGCSYAIYDLSAWPQRMLKLVVNNVGETPQLFDVFADPFETNDLSLQETAMVTNLTALRETLRTPVCPLEDYYDASCFTSPCNKITSESQCQSYDQLACEWVESATPYACVPITARPTKSPSMMPTVYPSRSPTETPSVSPSVAPSASPTLFPTGSPSLSPTLFPTGSPSLSPTLFPTGSPSLSPTLSPSDAPTSAMPSHSPSHTPSQSPSQSPSSSPTNAEEKPSTQDNNNSSATTTVLRATLVCTCFNLLYINLHER